MKSGIYAITNIITGRMYIGSSNDIKRRWREHKKDLRNGVHCNPYLQNSYNSHGIECFSFSTLLLCADNLIEKEKEYIELYKSSCPMYNYNDPVRQWYGKSCKEETRKKLSNALKEYYKIHGSPLKGRKLSEERKKNLFGGKSRARGRSVIVKRVGDDMEVGTYPSLAQAARELGLNKKRIQEVCARKKYGTNFKRNSYKGYIFEYR